MFASDCDYPYDTQTIPQTYNSATAVDYDMIVPIEYCIDSFWMMIIVSSSLETMHGELDAEQKRGRSEANGQHHKRPENMLHPQYFRSGRISVANCQQTQLVLNREVQISVDDLLAVDWARV